MSKLGVRGPAPTFQLSAAVAEEFDRALSCAVKGNTASLCALQDAVTACAREIKAAGITPEGMVMIIKAQFRAVARGHYSATEPLLRIEDHFLGEVVRWAIIAFYDAPGG